MCLTCLMEFGKTLLIDWIEFHRLRSDSSWLTAFVKYWLIEFEKSNGCFPGEDLDGDSLNTASKKLQNLHNTYQSNRRCGPTTVNPTCHLFPWIGDVTIPITLQRFKHLFTELVFL